jgi:hypothetical protein
LKSLMRRLQGMNVLHSTRRPRRVLAARADAQSEASTK